MSKNTHSDAQEGTSEAPESVWSIRMPEVVPVYNRWLQKTTYDDPEYRGPLGRMVKIHVVGHRHVEPTPPDTLDKQVELVPEPENAHDPNAIAVYHDGYRIGYIARTFTAVLHEWWAKIDQTGDVEGAPKLISTTSPYDIYLVDLP